MNQTLAKIVGAGLVAASIVGLYEIGRRTVTSGETADAPEPVSYGDDHYGVDLEESRGPSNMAPLESLTVEPSLPYVTFVDPESGEGIRSLVVVGAPGIWPPTTRTSGPRGGVYLPDTDIETLRGGEFHHFEVMARSSSRSLAYWDEVAFDQPNSPDAWPQRQLSMEPASTVDVRVTDPDGRPISRAKVQLSRRRIGFVHLNKRADPEGKAQFRTIPSGTYVASVHAPGAGRARAEFSHEAPSTSKVTVPLRSQPAPKVADSPNSSTSTRAEPREVSVRIDGLEEGEWTAAALHWRRMGGQWQLGTFVRGAESGVRHWRNHLRPGSYQLRILQPDGREARRRIDVGGESTSFTWSVALEQTIDLYVEDANGGPVSGAWVQVWEGDALVETATSRGTEPVEVAFDSEATFRIVAIDARRGEGARTVETGTAGGEVIVQLDRPLLSADRPPGRVRNPDRIEEILEAPLVRDNQSWLIDVRDPESRAGRAGLERADRLISLHEVGPDRWEAIVARGGQIVEVQLSSAEPETTRSSRRR